MPEATRWQDIYRCLKGAGFDVYSPAQKEGECVAPYIVVKDAATSKFMDFSSTITYYDILCYIPKEHFSTLELFVANVKEALGSLSPMIMPTHTCTSSFYDDTVKGHMVSMQYRNYKKI